MEVYLDNAATTRMSTTVINSMLPYMTEIYGNPSSFHSIGQSAAKALLEARNVIAECIGASPKEIIFTSGGSESDNQAIMSAVAIGEKTGKRHIISTEIEHHAVLNTLKFLKNKGFRVTFIKVDESGIVSPKDIENAICDDTCLVTVIYANNEIGTIQPITEIGRICREKGVIFHTDAVQAVGHLPINVKDEKIDMLSFSAHKFKGPKGIGVLYAKKGISLSSLIYGGAQERGKRAGTENIPSIVGMATALKEACLKIDESTKKVTELRTKLINGLLEIPDAVLNGDKEKRLAGNVSICFKGVNSEYMILKLDSLGIYVSSGSACESGSVEPSHVLRAIGRNNELARGALRFSLSDENTEEEIEYTVKNVREMVRFFRGH